MKKLMIALAAVAMGVAANAATVDWKVKRDVSSDTKSVLAYAFLGSDKAAVSAALAGYATTAAFLENFETDMKTISGFATLSAATGAANGAMSGSFAADKIADKSAQDVFLVIFDAKTLANATKYEITDNFSTAAVAYTAESQGSKVVAEGATANFGKAWNNIGGGDVPEPTSAMLLLLGVAGLSLRRRRA